VSAEDDAAGTAIVRASWIGTVALGVTAGAAVISPTFKWPAFAVAVAMFVVGTGSFLGALGIAARRSRDREIGMGGLFLLQGSAPNAVRAHLLGSLAAQTAIAFVTAGLEPYTSLAFGILAPVYGLGLAGLWGARHGTFGPRR
jgi:hypothetical protein